MATLPTLRPGAANTTGLPTTGSIIGNPGGSTALSDDSAATYDGQNTNSSGTYQYGRELANMPTDFGTMLTVSVQLQRAWASAVTNTTWNSLDARIVASDGSTVLAAATSGGTFQTVSTNITTTTPTNSSVVPFSYVNTSATKTQWDGAIVQVQWVRTRTKGGDSVGARVYEGFITGTYTLASTDKTGSFVATGGGTYTHAREKGAEGSHTATGGGVYTHAYSVSAGGLSHVTYYNGANVGGSTDPTIAVTGVSWVPGDLILVYVTWRESSATVASVTDDGPGETYSYQVGGQDVQGVIFAALYAATASGTGSSDTITVATTEASWVTDGGIQLEVHVVSGSSPTIDASHQTNTGATDTDTPSDDLTATQTPARRFAWFQTRNRTFTVDGGDGLTAIRENTQEGASGAISSISSYYRDDTGTGTKNASGTLSTALDWIATQVNVYEDAGTAKSGSFTVTGGGVYTQAAEKGATRADAFTGGGVYTQAGEKGGEGAYSVTGGGVYTQDAAKGGEAGFTATGGGVYTHAYSLTEAHSGSFTVTGGGIYTQGAEKGGELTDTTTGGGVVVVSATHDGAGSYTATGGGVYTHAYSVFTPGAATGSFTVTGGGVYTQGAEKGGEAGFTATGGGNYIASGAKGAEASFTATGAGTTPALLSGDHTGTLTITGGGVFTVAAEGPMALSNLGEVMDALAVAVASNELMELVYAYPVEGAVVPCAIIGYPQTVDFDVTFQVAGVHTDKTVIPVYFVVGKANQLAARDMLTSVIGGAYDLKADIEGNATLLAAVQTVRVTECQIAEMTLGGVAYLAARFDCEVLV